MKHLNIRARLLLSYVLLVGFGFGLLAVLAGQQLSSAARSDYEQRLRNEIVLLGNLLEDDLRLYAQGTLDAAALAEAFATYEAQLGGKLEVFFTGFEPDQSANTARHRIRPDALPEIAAAIGQTVGIVERPDAEGRMMFYAAVSIEHRSEPVALLRLSVPPDALWQTLFERWIALLGATLAMLGLALLFALWFAHMLTRPIALLGDSALRLSRGDLQHRYAGPAYGEFGALGHSFNTMADQLQQMLDEQRAFASNAAHELRTPLTTIQLRAETLGNAESLDTPRARQYISEMEAEAIRLGKLVQGLSLLARLDAGRMELGHDLVDMGRFAHALHQQFAPQAAEKHISFSLSLHTEAPLEVQASLTHLNIVFRNLIENALKYTPDGGSITWHIQAQGATIEQRISDTGVGIAAEDLPRIFERFYRADKARSRDVGGTGLGLSLVKRIVEAYGGCIEAHSTGLGQGTQITLLWPRPKLG